mgnify:CR=1 FL=1
MVFVTGPRQVGKTYLAKEIMSEFNSPQYLNYDNIFDRKIIFEQSWKRNADLIVFDEIHKMKDWKLYLKGLFDTRNNKEAILVTGSARLETFRQTGESLAGRYNHLRLNPISVKELSSIISPYEAIETINKFSGFPEPLLNSLNNIEKAVEFSNRWRNQYYIDLVREDILEFGKLQEIRAIKNLLEMLRHRVGSPISYKGLAEDLQISPTTVKKYIEILESLYIVFLIKPFHKNIARSILKEPKLYFYDSSYILGDEGIKLENTIAIHLLKHTQYLYDTKGKDISLSYVRTKDNKEVDFVIVENQKPINFIEVKLSDRKISPNLSYFSNKYKNSNFIQLVHNLKNEEHKNGIDLLSASNWLEGLAV